MIPEVIGIVLIVLTVGGGAWYFTGSHAKGPSTGDMVRKNICPFCGDSPLYAGSDYFMCRRCRGMFERSKYMRERSAGIKAYNEAIIKERDEELRKIVNERI